MPKAFSKVQKQISRKRHGQIHSLNPDSRDAKRLRKASARDDKLAKMAVIRNRLSQPFLRRVAFFKNEIENNIAESFTQDEVQSLINKYIHRNDEELLRLQSARRPGRPSTAHEDQLKQQTELEEREYESGYWVPDLQNISNITTVKKWNGEWSSLNVVEFVRISKDGIRHQSSFPPKGQS